MRGCLDDEEDAEREAMESESAEEEAVAADEMDKKETEELTGVRSTARDEEEEEDEGKDATMGGMERNREGPR